MVVPEEGHLLLQRARRADHAVEPPEHVVTPLVDGVERLAVDAGRRNARQGRGSAVEQPADRGAACPGVPSARLSRRRAEAGPPEQAADVSLGPAVAAPGPAAAPAASAPCAGLRERRPTLRGRAQGRGPRALGPRAARGRTSSCARSAQSQRIGRVSRGSMISSTLKRSAVRNGERDRFEARGDLGAQRHRVIRGLELAPVGRLQAARHRKRAPVARRPGVAQVQPRAVAVSGTRHAVDLADKDRHPGHGCLDDREQARARRAGSCPRARRRCRSRSPARRRSSRRAGGTGRTGPRSARSSRRRPR